MAKQVRAWRGAKVVRKTKETKIYNIMKYKDKIHNTGAAWLW
jgi:hypothetical protein